MRKKSKTFEMSYEDESLRLNGALSSFICSFETFFEYYGSDFTRGYLQFMHENPKGEKEYRLVLAYPGATAESAPRIHCYTSSEVGLKSSYEIRIPYQCPNALAKNLIAFAVTLGGLFCFTDTQRTEVEKYMEFLNNSYTGKEPSDVLKIDNHHKIFICPDEIMDWHVVAVISCNEIEGVNTDIKLEEYEDYTGSKMLSTCYKDKKALITGVVTANKRKMSRSILDVSSGEKIYRILYEYVPFIDYLDCFEIGKECNFYGTLLYNNKWHEDDGLRSSLGHYDGHLLLEYVTRR